MHACCPRLLAVSRAAFQRSQLIIHAQASAESGVQQEVIPAPRYTSQPAAPPPMRPQKNAQIGPTGESLHPVPQRLHCRGARRLHGCDQNPVLGAAGACEMRSVLAAGASAADALQLRGRRLGLRVYCPRLAGVRHSDIGFSDDCGCFGQTGTCAENQRN